MYAVQAHGRRLPTSFYDMPPLREDDHGVIFEFVPMGHYVKVSAVDTRTGVEVSIVGDPMQGEAALRRVVLRKLDYVMRRKAEPTPP